MTVGPVLNGADAGSSARWFAVGHASGADVREAGAEATARALERDDARLLVVFCSDSYDLGELLAGIRTEAPDVPLIGCSTAGEIADASGAGGQLRRD